MLLLYHILLSLDHHQSVAAADRGTPAPSPISSDLRLHDQHGHRGILALLSSDKSSLIYQMYLLDILITVILTIISTSC